MPPACLPASAPTHPDFLPVIHLRASKSNPGPRWVPKVLAGVCEVKAILMITVNLYLLFRSCFLTNAQQSFPKDM